MTVELNTDPEALVETIPLLFAELEAVAVPLVTALELEVVS